MKKSLNKIETAFLSLLKGSVVDVSDYSDFPTLTTEEWERLYLLADVQGMISVVISELEKLPKEKQPYIDLLMEWFGQSQYQMSIYRQQLDESSEYADALAKKGVMCIVLKGLAVGSYYPVEGAREFGDLDCFLVKGGKSAFEIGNEIGRELGADVEQSGCKHTHIHYKQLLIENHEYLTNFNNTKQGVFIEKILRKLALDGGYKQIGDSNLWIPSAEFNVLFLLKHSLDDFFANDMTIKAVYDWAVFMKAELNNIDWKRMTRLLNDCRLRPIFDLMTESAMSYCGLVAHERTIEVTSSGQIAKWLIEDVLNIQLPMKKKTLFLMTRRFLDRMMRMVKYHRITTERIRTTLWSSLMFRLHIKRKFTLE